MNHHIVESAQLAVERETGIPGLAQWMVSHGFWTAPEGVDKEGSPALTRRDTTSSIPEREKLSGRGIA